LKFDVERKIILGNGSNSIFTKDFDGLIIHNEILGIDIVEEDKKKVLLRCGAGVLWNDLINFCVGKNFYGIENLVGIPGSVGASPIQNIGAYGVDVATTIAAIEFIKFDDLTTIILQNSHCNFSYRDSIFKHELQNRGCITKVFFTLSKIPNFNLTYGSLKNFFSTQELDMQNLVRTIKKIRDEKIPDPAVQSNVGSFFQNAIISRSQTKDLLLKFPGLAVWPVDGDYDKISSAGLISQCGLGNFSKYGLKVNKKNPLVIINEDCRRGKDLFKFVDEIKKIIFAETKILLSLEPNIF
jgi:UDP-N-acetylmuramate dehydrogenase